MDKYAFFTGFKCLASDIAENLADCKWTPRYEHGHFIDVIIVSDDTLIRFIGNHENLQDVIDYVRTLPPNIPYLCGLNGDHPSRLAASDLEFDLYTSNKRNNGNCTFLHTMYNAIDPGGAAEFAHRALPRGQFNRIAVTTSV